MAGKLKPFTLPEPAKDQNFSSIDPLDSRYYDIEISRYLSEQSRISYQAYMEAALAHALADYGICSRKIANEIEASARKVTAQEVYKEEQKTKHDIKALVNCIKKYVSKQAQPYVHFGATSYDIVASAQVLQMRSAINELVVPRLKNLNDVLIELTERYAGATQIGRTHGQHALPITFGFAVAEYVQRIGECTQAIEALTSELPGKFSGAVGAYNALSTFIDKPLEFEKTVLDYVGIMPSSYSTQILPPEYMVRLIDEQVIAAGIMANLAHDMRHLQRSEIGEVRERFETGQTGSSTMAHKRNPWNFENIVSMSKQIIAQGVNANLNLSSEHQRDLTDSASSRFYSVVIAGIASMATRLCNVMSKLEVDEEAMQRNLNMSGGAIAAEPLYLLLAKYGHTSAHEKSKALAHKSLDSGKTLVETIAADKEASAYWQKFTKKQQQIIEYPEKYYTGLAAKKARTVAKRWHI
ncbi:MAG TPA: lyase family protein [Patescibacteria group bacterium]|nr:lyase family protein [Patescibacteria group bacterium]